MRFAAQGRAAAAELREHFVGGVVAHLRAGVADLGAGAAGDFVQLRMSEHEIVRGVGDLRAVEEHSDVPRAGVGTALFQAVVNRVLARVVDFLARVDALIHFGGLMLMNVGHGWFAGWAFGRKSA